MFLLFKCNSLINTTISGSISASISSPFSASPTASLFPSASLLASPTASKMSKQQQTRPSSDMAAFRRQLKVSKSIVALTGAGISAESGIPTFRGAGGLWRTYKSQDLATPSAFKANPSLVWQFYSYRRDLVLSKRPNAAHIALADAEKRMKEEGKTLTIVTQNVDELHSRAGSDAVIELHGSLFSVICTSCGYQCKNYDSPIAETLRSELQPDLEINLGKKEPDLEEKLDLQSDLKPESDLKMKPDLEKKIPIQELPSCGKCNSLLRPGVVWFNEQLNPEVLKRAQAALDACDLCLVIGTSAIVYPAAMFAPAVAARGVTVAEFNLEPTPSTDEFNFHFEGSCAVTLVDALKS